MAMLTTPTRSHRTPERDPKTSGTAKVTDPAISPAREIDGSSPFPPATIQTMNPMRNTAANVPPTQRGAAFFAWVRYTV